MSIKSIINDSIARSTFHNEIVDIIPADGREREALCDELSLMCALMCDDDADTCGTSEFLGTTDDGAEWCVHVYPVAE